MDAPWKTGQARLLLLLTEGPSIASASVNLPEPSGQGQCQQQLGRACTSYHRLLLLHPQKSCPTDVNRSGGCIINSTLGCPPLDTDLDVFSQNAWAAPQSVLPCGGDVLEGVLLAGILHHEDCRLHENCYAELLTLVWLCGQLAAVLTSNTHQPTPQTQHRRNILHRQPPTKTAAVLLLSVTTNDRQTIPSHPRPVCCGAALHSKHLRNAMQRALVSD